MSKDQGRASIAGFIFVFLMIAMMGTTAMPENINEFYKILPAKIGGWTKADPPGIYSPKTLSDYIDGGAELFLSYGFRGALSLKYQDAAENEITIDIFDMGTSADAFGVFAHSRETIDNRVGQGCEYASGLLTFWKDRYYASILAYPETAEKRDLVLKLGRTIADAIKREGPLPPIISLLPAENLLPETVHYFHHYIWLNSFTFVSNENVLNIGDDTPAALGKYRQSGTAFFLLLVRYPDAARAEAAGEQFRQKLLAGAADGMRATAEGRWMGLERHGDLVGVVLNAPDAATVRATFAKIKE